LIISQRKNFFNLSFQKNSAVKLFFLQRNSHFIFKNENFYSPPSFERRFFHPFPERSFAFYSVNFSFSLFSAAQPFPPPLFFFSLSPLFTVAPRLSCWLPLRFI